jgi:hypothetical protein
MNENKNLADKLLAYIRKQPDRLWIPANRKFKMMSDTEGRPMIEFDGDDKNRRATDIKNFMEYNSIKESDLD